VLYLRKIAQVYTFILLCSVGFILQLLIFISLIHFEFAFLYAWSSSLFFFCSGLEILLKSPLSVYSTPIPYVLNYWRSSLWTIFPCLFAHHNFFEFSGSSNNVIKEGRRSDSSWGIIVVNNCCFLLFYFSE
jgi:hypothetical protein